MAKAVKEKAPDWKAIAIALGQRVNFAITRIEAKGTGLLVDLNSGKSQHWHDYMLEGLEMLPGIKVDKDAFLALRLPAAQRRKRLKELASAKKSAQAS